MDMPDWVKKWESKVQTSDDLVEFVNAVGFCTINALERFPSFPSQEIAMGRDDVLGHTWFWKDDLHIQKKLFYTRLFANKPGYISFDFLPALIATNGEVADELFMYGSVSATAQEIYRLIEIHGPISSRDLKKMLGSDSRKSANNILIDLECRFLITKTDISGRVRSTYGYVWDLAERWVPEAFEAADKLGTKAAREQILSKLAELGVEADDKFRQKVLRWK